MYNPGQVLDHPHTKYYRCVLQIINENYYKVLFINKVDKTFFENKTRIEKGIYNISDLTIDELKAKLL